MKYACLFLICCFPVLAADLPEKYAPLGQLIITPFTSAPFPHPARAEGHTYHDKVFSAAEHYQDSDVALFVPKDFHAKGKVDFVVHFHGWNNTATNALPKYELVDQFSKSGRNAILIVPQGPFNSPDSFGGKLEDAGGFKRFMDEAMDTLRQRGVIKDSEIGRIILSGHSGGYEVISAIVAVGGLSDHVREVWLFDALYARTERFVTWFDNHKGRFVDIYTEHGGTKEETQDLMAALQGNHVPFYSGDEATVTAKDLRDHHLIFLFSKLPHDETPQAHETFRQLLETSALDRIKH
jgi:hypothetical protein